MTREEKDIAKGYMSGKFLKQETKKGTNILVTENKSYSDLTHRRAVFFVDNTFFVLVDEGYGEGSTPSVNLSFNLCPDTKDVAIDDESANYQYGAHTLFTDNNNMLFRTFVETKKGYSATNSTAYTSNKIEEKTQRRFYRVNITKPENGAARFITVIYPFKTEADFEKINIDAKFIDNTETSAGTFHENGAAVEVTINGQKYELSYTL